MPKHVIVTGGSRGIGAAITQDLLTSGYRVSACSRTRTEVVGRLETDPQHRDRFHWAVCDVADSDQVAAFVTEAPPPQKRDEPRDKQAGGARGAVL